MKIHFKKIIISFILLLCFPIITNASCESGSDTSITQHAITWTFDQAYQCGQFVTGDYWVVGPVTITSIDPEPIYDISYTTDYCRHHGGAEQLVYCENHPTDYLGEYAYADYCIDYECVYVTARNGFMINPVTADGHNFDSRARQHTYDVSLDLPLSVPVQSSLISTKSKPDPTECTDDAGRDGWYDFFGDCIHEDFPIEDVAILTVLSSSPLDNSFRPAYSGNDKTMYSTENLDYSLLGNLGHTADTPSMQTALAPFSRPWLDFLWEWDGAQIHHSYMETYGRDISADSSIAAMMLNMDFADAEKQELLYKYIQLGIDNYAIIENGGGWPNNGGHSSGRKFPIILAGIMLDNDDMKNIGSWDTTGARFGEDDQTYYVSQEEVERTSGDSFPYQTSDIGLAEWGIRHADSPEHDAKSWDSRYRQCCNAVSWYGFILSAHIMDAKDLWNHDALFDYQDRYSQVTATGGANPGHHSNHFASSLWDIHRDNYGCTWKMDDPTDTYSQGHYDCDGENVRCAWANSDTGIIAQTCDDYPNQRACDYDPCNLGCNKNCNLASPVCGNSIAESGETCDGTDLNGNTCISQGYDTGSLSCLSDCSGFDTENCEDIPESGSTYHIRSDASGNNDGSDWNNAYTELPDNLERGATHYIADGTYPSYDFDDSPSGTNLIKIKKATMSDHGSSTGWQDSFGDGKTVFSPISFSQPYYYVDGNGLNLEIRGELRGNAVNIGSEHVTLKSIDMNGNFQESGGTQTMGSCSCLLISASYASILDSHIHDAADDGLEMHSGSYLKFKNNTISNLHSCGTDNGCGQCYNGHSDGIEIFGIENSNFTENLVYEVGSTAAVFMGNLDGIASNLLFENNIFYTPETGFIFYLQEVNNIKLYNNILWGKVQGSYGGLAIGPNVNNLDMYNNIILSINYAHMGASYIPSEHRGNYNMFGYSTGQYTENTNDIVNSDPLFSGIPDAYGNQVFDPVKNDFMIDEESQATNSGYQGNSEIKIPETDIFGNSRDSFPDIGAIEYQGTISACSDQEGTCCSQGQTCEGGSFSSSGDCANRCCIGGTCSDTEPTCLNQGYYCCDECASGHISQFDSTCSNFCCEECRTICFTSTSAWNNFPLQFPMSESFILSFNTTIHNMGSDGLISFADSQGSTWSDYAITVRFNTNNNVDARNGGSYQYETLLNYTTNLNYDVRFEVDMETKTYSAYVTPEGGQEYTIASDYAFRTGQQDVTELSYWALSATHGSHTTCIKYQEYHEADSNQNNIIDFTEINTFIQRWKKTSEISLRLLVEAIDIWKNN